MCASSTETYSTMKFRLNAGNMMPFIGMGTYRIRKPEAIMQVVDYALDAGYRMFDTAAVYGNEMHLGEALRTLLPKYSLDREDVFVTTKLSPSDHGRKEVVGNAFQKSLDNLGMDYVDLFLVHFPGTARLPEADPKNAELRDQTWRSMAELYDDGRAYSVGVSNFTVKHLQQLMMSNHGVTPAVNQVEWHPYYYQNDLLKFCKQNDIVVQAYCSLGGSITKQKSLLADPIVMKIANKVQATSAQVLLAWALQKDVGVIPKSTDPAHIKENININFRISDEDMKALDSLGANGHKFAWDPSNVA